MKTYLKIVQYDLILLRIFSISTERKYVPTVLFVYCSRQNYFSAINFGTHVNTLRFCSNKDNHLHNPILLDSYSHKLCVIC